MSLQKNIVAALSNLTENGLVIKSVDWQTGEIRCSVKSDNGFTYETPSADAPEEPFDPRIIGPTRKHGFAPSGNNWGRETGPLTLDEYNVCATNVIGRSSKIEAIKYVRQERELGLDEAKRLVEANFKFPAC